MKIPVVLVGGSLLASAAIALVSSEQLWPRNRELRGQICVERAEENGILNIRPVDVVIGDGPTLTLAGEQAACAFVRPGEYQVWAQSADPYDPNPPKTAMWKAPLISISLKTDERVTLEVCATGTGATYRNWNIQRTGVACR